METIIIFGILTVIVMSMLACKPVEKKKAMLVVSFGTSHADTRALTLDATEAAFEERFTAYDVYKAYTSQTIINILSKRDNIEVNNVKQALEALKKDNYDHVVIQSLHVMNGSEYDDMLAVINDYKDEFAEIKVGKALLTSHDDYYKTIEALAVNFPEKQEGHAIVFMGHGTHHEANAVYAALEYVFKSNGYDHVYVGTVSGFPTFDDVLNQLEKDQINKVTLMPLMMVAGDHAANDMAGNSDDSWKTMLKKAGFKVDIHMHGMGENPSIRNLFISHAENVIGE